MLTKKSSFIIKLKFNVTFKKSEFLIFTVPNYKDNVYTIEHELNKITEIHFDYKIRFTYQ